jgi:hypothetical protein
MGEYPLKAALRVSIDAASDIPALMASDAEGRLEYSGGQLDIFPGQLWIEVAEHEPALRPRVIATVEAFLRDPDTAKRSLAVHIAEHVSDAAIEGALADAFAADTGSFVGVPAQDGSTDTLFTIWLRAALNGAEKDTKAFVRAATAAQAFLSLPEARNQDIAVYQQLGEPLSTWLPTALANASDDKMQKFILSQPTRDLPAAASALAALPQGDRERFLRLAEQFLKWQLPAKADALMHDLRGRLRL